MAEFIPLIVGACYVLGGAITFGFFDAKNRSPMGDNFIDALLWPISVCIYFGQKLGGYRK